MSHKADVTDHIIDGFFFIIYLPPHSSVSNCPTGGLEEGNKKVEIGLKGRNL